VQHEKSSTYVVLPRDGIGLDYISTGGLGSVVGIASGYGLDGPGSNPGGGRDFTSLSRPALGPTPEPVQWVVGLSGG
jgi:hypothetical protein